MLNGTVAHNFALDMDLDRAFEGWTRFRLAVVGGRPAEADRSEDDNQGRSQGRPA